MTPNDRRKMIRTALDDEFKDFVVKTGDEMERLSTLIWKDEREALVAECDERVKAAEDETQAMACELATEREKTRMAKEEVGRMNALLDKVRAQIERS